MFISAIIPAAGSGVRFGDKKQFKVINGHPLIYHTLKPFLESNMINEVVVVASEQDMGLVKKIILSLKPSKNILVVTGSSTRQGSIKNALKSINKKTNVICIHDAVRPFVTKKLISRLIKSLQGNDSIIVGKKSTDTLKHVVNSLVEKTLNREEVWSVQTPQVFHKEVLLDAYEKASNENLIGTDDAALLEKAGYKVKIIEDNSINFKITTKEDWTIAQALFRRRN